AVDDMALSLGESDLAGKLTANLQGARPAVLAELTGTKLDLADLQAATERQEEPVSTAPGEPAGGEEAAQQGDGQDQAGSRYVIPDTPLPLALLQSADAEVTIKLGQLVVDPETTLDDVDLALRLENGRLELSKLAAKAFEGSL